MGCLSSKPRMKEGDDQPREVAEAENGLAKESLEVAAPSPGADATGFRHTSDLRVGVIESKSTSVTLLNDYVILCSLGKGAYGSVKLCFSMRDNGLYALKVLERAQLKRQMLGRSGAANAGQGVIDALRREVDVMRSMNHPNLIRIFEVIEAENKVVMVQEYAEAGPLAQTDQAMCEPLAQYYFRQIVAGLESLHSQGVVHGDIKPDNVLLSGSGLVKIADFGQALFFDAGESDVVDKTLGTPAFMAPEMRSGAPFHAMPTDMWALGVTLYSFLFGDLPFKGETLDELYGAIKTREVEYPEGTPISDDLRSLLDSLLHKDPKKRPTSSELMFHPWVAEEARKRGDVRGDVALEIERMDDAPSLETWAAELAVQEAQEAAAVASAAGSGSVVSPAASNLPLVTDVAVSVFGHDAVFGQDPLTGAPSMSTGAFLSSILESAHPSGMTSQSAGRPSSGGHPSGLAVQLEDDADGLPAPTLKQLQAAADARDAADAAGSAAQAQGSGPAAGAQQGSGAPALAGSGEHTHSQAQPGVSLADSEAAVAAAFAAAASQAKQSAQAEAAALDAATCLLERAVSASEQLHLQEQPAEQQPAEQQERQEQARAPPAADSAAAKSHPASPEQVAAALNRLLNTIGDELVSVGRNLIPPGLASKSRGGNSAAAAAEAGVESSTQSGTSSGTKRRLSLSLGLPGRIASGGLSFSSPQKQQQQRPGVPRRPHEPQAAEQFMQDSSSELPPVHSLAATKASPFGGTANRGSLPFPSPFESGGGYDPAGSPASGLAGPPPSLAPPTDASTPPLNRTSAVGLAGGAGGGPPSLRPQQAVGFVAQRNRGTGLALSRPSPAPLPVTSAVWATYRKKAVENKVEGVKFVAIPAGKMIDLDPRQHHGCLLLESGLVDIRYVAALPLFQKGAACGAGGAAASSSSSEGSQSASSSEEEEEEDDEEEREGSGVGRTLRRRDTLARDPEAQKVHTRRSSRQLEPSASLKQTAERVLQRAQAILDSAAHNCKTNMLTGERGPNDFVGVQYLLDHEVYAKVNKMSERWRAVLVARTDVTGVMLSRSAVELLLKHYPLAQVYLRITLSKGRAELLQLETLEKIASCIRPPRGEGGAKGRSGKGPLALNFNSRLDLFRAVSYARRLAAELAEQVVLPSGF